ncbi:MAG: DsbA family protein, partial [Pseudoxanthomonas sp.]|nr:DsbA family protein [Pseudoxanthomonas sp.]
VGVAVMGIVVLGEGASPAHPFNPLAALRLCVAAGTTTRAIDAIFDAIWREGRPGDDVATLATAAAVLDIADPAAATAEAAVKQRLRANTDAALAAGVFGVPTLAIDGELFWGNDSHPLIQAVLDDPGLLRSGALADVGAIPVGVERRH